MCFKESTAEHQSVLGKFSWSLITLWASWAQTLPWRSHNIIISISRLVSPTFTSHSSQHINETQCPTSESPVCSVKSPENHTAALHVNREACFYSGRVLSGGTGWNTELRAETCSWSLITGSLPVWIKHIQIKSFVISSYWSWLKRFSLTNNGHMLYPAVTSRHHSRLLLALSQSLNTNSRQVRLPPVTSYRCIVQSIWTFQWLLSFTFDLILDFVKHL